MSEKKQIQQVAILYDITIDELEIALNDWIESIQIDGCKILDIKLGTHEDNIMAMVVYTRDIEV